jgi:hypothetical protein
MADNRIRITTPLEWGKLVKSWATGRSYFHPGQPAPPIPQTLEELKQQCKDFDIVIEIPETITGLAFLQYSAETLSVRLPPKSLIDQSEAILEVANYELPAFYEAFFNDPPLTREKKRGFHACRLGEYSVNSCM